MIPIPFLSVVPILGGKKYLWVVVTPTVPASAKSTAHRSVVVPIPTPAKTACFSILCTPISGLSIANAVPSPIAPPSSTKNVADPVFAIITKSSLNLTSVPVPTRT